MVKEKFKTKLFTSAVLGVFFAASPTMAFFVGNIEVKSKFGEKLEASFEIHLDNSEGYEIALGEAIDYEKMGLIRSPLVNSLLLEKPVTTTETTKIIRVFSRVPLFFPSFNLVVKASHNGGTLLENFLVTVDFQKGLALTTPGERKKKPSIPPFKSSVTKNENSAEAKKILPLRPKEDLLLKDKGMRLTLKSDLDKNSERKNLAIKPTTIIKSVQKRRRLTGAIWASPKKVFPIKKPSPEEPFFPKSGKKVKSGEGILFSRSDLIRLKKGEGLFSVARKIKINKIHPSRIEVALWIKNIEKFIYGNINGVQAGAQFEMEGIEKLAEKIDLQTAKNILMGQAKEWKIIRKKVVDSKETKTRIKETLLPTEKIDQVATIFDWIEKWKSSWEENDIDRHVSFYHGSSIGKENLNSGKIVSAGERKRKLFLKFPNPSLSLSAQNLMSRPGGSWVVFEQHFFSKTMESAGTKELKMERVNGNWKINEEEFYLEKHDITRSIQRVEGKAENSRPFVIHVSSHSEESEAISVSNKLRQNGYDAYLAPVRISKDTNIYRVFIGRFTSWNQAHRIIKALEKNNWVGYPMVIPYPFALRVGEVSSILEARQLLNKLRSKGLSGLLSISKSGYSKGIQFEVYVGAFKKSGNAVWLMKKLSEGGFSFKLIRP